VLHKGAELLQARRAASAGVEAGGAGAGEDDRVDRKRHNVTITPRGPHSLPSAVSCMSRTRSKLRKLKVAELKAVLTAVHAGGQARQQAGRAHDLTVAQPVSDTHLGRPGVGRILPNEVLAANLGKHKLLVILFAISYFESNIPLYISRAPDRRCTGACGGKREARRIGGRAWREM
jgi:hypothetical protein